MSSFPIAVLASGSGTNLQAILDRLQGRGAVEVVAVGSDKPEAKALERAAAAGVPTAVFPRSEYADREARDGAIADWLEERGARLVVLAGYMQLLSAGFIERFTGRVINVHPALLPAFPGLDAQHQAWTHGVKVSGATVHFVNAELDAGPIVMQAAVPVEDGDTVDSLSARILVAEHRIYPAAIARVLAGGWRIVGRRVSWG